MFKVGNEVTYIFGQVANHLVIETVNNNIATVTSGEFGGMGPFAMTFDATTGEGIGEYINTKIVHGARKMATHFQLSKWIEDNTDTKQYNEVKEATHWFISHQRANEAMEMNTREAAELYANGITATDDVVVNDWLEMHYEEFTSEYPEDINRGIEIAEKYLLSGLNDHHAIQAKSL